MLDHLKIYRSDSSYYIRAISYVNAIYVLRTPSEIFRTEIILEQVEQVLSLTSYDIITMLSIINACSLPAYTGSFWTPDQRFVKSFQEYLEGLIC